jgi:iron complex outermembrane receptor protein
MKQVTLFIAVIVTAAAIRAAPAYAQQSTAANAPAPSGGLEEIVVTARRRAEAEQTTPVSITAFTAADLQDRTISTVEELARQTPSFNVMASAYDPFSLTLGIRGQQATDVVLAQPSPIGVYVDDVYEATTIATQTLNFDDVTQVEVLKGPQGTLYGRNTTGGAIKITTALPDYDGVHGDVKIGYGNYADKTVSSIINLPILDQRLALNLSARYEDRGGYGSLLGTDQPINNWNSRSARAALRFDVTDQLQIVARAWFSDSFSNGQPANLVYIAPGATAANLAVATQIGALTPTDFGILAGKIVPTPAQYAAFLSHVNAGYLALSAYKVSPYSQNAYAINPALLAAFGDTHFGIGTGQHANAKVAGGSFTTNYQFTPDLYLKSITAAGLTQRQSFQNTGGSPFLLITGDIIDQGPHQFTEELQLGGNALADALKWVTGYYYFDMHGDDNSPGVLQVVPLGPNPSDETANVSDISQSFYGQGTYTIVPTLHFTGGVRYTYEKTNTNNMTYSVIGGVPTCQVVPGAPVGPECFGTSPYDFRNTSYTGGLDWQALSDLLLYAKTSSGFRAGGAGIRPPFLAFQPETVTDYEVGGKAEWLDHRVRTNVALYQSNYDNIQRTVLTTVPGTAQVDTAIQNAAKAKIRGAELEVTVVPAPGWTVSLNGAFTDAGYVKYIAPATGEDLSQHVFANTPRWQGSAAATYVFNDGLGDLTSTLVYAYKSEVDYQPDNHVVVNGVPTNPYTIQGGFGMIDARITQNIRSMGLLLSLWGRNLTDKQYIAYGTDITGPLGYTEVQPGIPRTYGVEFTKKF